MSPSGDSHHECVDTKLHENIDRRLGLKFTAVLPLPRVSHVESIGEGTRIDARPSSIIVVPDLQSLSSRRPNKIEVAGFAEG